jgi:hypothetical protein
LSKRSKNTPRKSDVFFLDRNLGSEKLAALLRPAGFHLVTHHDRYGPQAQFVDDPTVIAGCGRSKTILLTADGNLEYTYAVELLTAKIAVLLLTNNSEGPAKWAPRIIAAIPEINRELRRQKKPFLMRLSVAGKLTQVRLYRKKGAEIIRLGSSKPH